MPANLTCPYCQAPLNVTDQPGARTLHCPHCLCDVENPRMEPASEAPNLLRDIRRSGRSFRRWSGWLVIGFIAAQCVAQIVYAKINDTTAPSPNRAFISLSYCPGLLGLDVLALIVIGRILRRFFFAEEGPVTSGQLLGYVLLTVGLTLAVSVFFFVVCNAMC
jgi:hypothetical protein